MSESERKTSRISRKPSFLYSDDEEVVNRERPRRSARKDLKSSTFSITQMSRVLAKFVNQANIYYKDKRKDLRRQKKDKERIIDAQNTKVTSKAQRTSQNFKKTSISLNPSIIDKANKRKDLYSFKQSSLTKQIKNQGKYINSIKESSYPLHYNFSSNPYAYNFMMNLPLSNQLQSFKQMYPIIKEIKEYLGDHKIQPTDLRFMSNQLPQIQRDQQQKNKDKLQKTQKNVSHSNRNQFTEKKYTNEGKLFTRASFHVAIAYNIYFKKLQHSGVQLINPQQLDPTRHAKKIKQQKHQSLQFQQTR